MAAPVPFDQEVRDLSRLVFDGLVLDLRLDRAANSTGDRVNYRALSLAQELRTRMTESDIASYPLVLWSIDDNFKKSYEKDETSHDLFDRRYWKASIGEDRSRIAAELVDLAQSYKKIRSYKSKTVKHIYERLIELPNAFEILDARIAVDMAEDRTYPAHIFARSIMQNLILGSGPLIDEDVLAARLGVDTAHSGDWAKLKTKFASPAQYTGVFGKAESQRNLRADTFGTERSLT